MLLTAKCEKIPEPNIKKKKRKKVSTKERKTENFGKLNLLVKKKKKGGEGMEIKTLCGRKKITLHKTKVVGSLDFFLISFTLKIYSFFLLKRLRASCENSQIIFWCFLFFFSLLLFQEQCSLHPI